MGVTHFVSRAFLADLCLKLGEKATAGLLNTGQARLAGTRILRCGKQKNGHPLDIR